MKYRHLFWIGAFAITTSATLVHFGRAAGKSIESISTSVAINMAAGIVLISIVTFFAYAVTSRRWKQRDGYIHLEGKFYDQFYVAGLVFYSFLAPMNPVTKLGTISLLLTLFAGCSTATYLAIKAFQKKLRKRCKTLQEASVEERETLFNIASLQKSKYGNSNRGKIYKELFSVEDIYASFDGDLQTMTRAYPIIDDMCHLIEADRLHETSKA